MRYQRVARLGLGLRFVLLLFVVGSAMALMATPAAAADRLEVFSWWTGPGEQEGLDALIADFKKKNPGVEVINAAVSGGAGTNAKAILAVRLQSGDPPGSYQRHAGLELQDDIKAGFVEDVTYLFDQQGWKQKMPQGLLQAITIDGKLYSVPVNIHRSNLLWFNPKVLQEAGIAAPPKTWSEFLTQAETLKAKGKTPLAIGPAWTQKHLLENVLLGELGPDKYAGLWTGKTDWNSTEVIDALEMFKKVLAMSDIRSAGADWQPVLDKVVDGSAAYNVMGDWADAYLGRARKLTFKTDYDVVPSPGTDGIYNFLSDSFTLPKGARNRAVTEKWLIECGSAEGQDLFNVQKGSVPARTDVDTSKYTGYLATALKEWHDPQIRIVGSLAHGVVANNALNAEIDTGLGLFVQNGDVKKFATFISKAYEATK